MLQAKRNLANFDSNSFFFYFFFFIKIQQYDVSNYAVAIPNIGKPLGTFRKLATVVRISACN